MSKTRETLRKNGTPHLDTTGAWASVTIPAIVAEENENEEEMPFIEVGPRRSFEALGRRSGVHPSAANAAGIDADARIRALVPAFGAPSTAQRLVPLADHALALRSGTGGVS